MKKKNSRIMKNKQIRKEGKNRKNKSINIHIYKINKSGAS